VPGRDDPHEVAGLALVPRRRRDERRDRGQLRPRRVERHAEREEEVVRLSRLEARLEDVEHLEVALGRPAVVGRDGRGQRELLPGDLVLGGGEVRRRNRRGEGRAPR
jgi:hypothetical protein